MFLLCAKVVSATSSDGFLVLWEPPDLLFHFYRASYASAVLAVVVCPSVCLSVCLSQAGIVSKRQHIESRKQRHTVAQGI